MTVVADAPEFDATASPAAAASYLYALLAESFGYPDDEFADGIRSGRTAQRITELCGVLDPALLEGLDLSPLSSSAADTEALAVEYTRLFDAGQRGTLCALNGGLQVGPQMKVMEEAVRFYGHFGLTLTEEQKELPDHLTTELNFLHYLAYAECALQARGAAAAPYRLARRDFLARHPGRWVPVMLAKLRTVEPMPVFLVQAEILARLLAWDLAQLQAAHGPASLDPSGALPFDGL